MSAIQEKLIQIEQWLDEQHAEALVIGRRENFAWLTEGQESGIMLSMDLGFVYLVITKREKYVVAMRADIRKATEELLKDAGFTPVEVIWGGESKEDAVLRLLDGKKAIADMSLPNVKMDMYSIYDMQYPLSASVMKTYQEIGKECADIMYQTAIQVKAGMTENQIANILKKECLKYDVELDVLIIGADDRIKKYRHCTPTNTVCKQVVLISPVFRKYGLHVNLARMICFNEIPESTRGVYDMVSQIQAEIIVHSKSGVLFSDIYDLQEKMYHDYNYEHEWKTHMHGAPIGYMISHGDVLFRKEAVMKKNQAYEWYVTITGAKSAELILNIEDTIEVASLDNQWPVKSFVTESGHTIELPDILVLK